MSGPTIKELRDRLAAGDLSYQELEDLAGVDPRSGVQSLLKQLQRERIRQEQEWTYFREREVLCEKLRKQGYSSIAGLDEVGRGPLAGPVVAVAVILEPKTPILGLRDSKKLTAAKREKLAREIMEQARAFSVAEVDVETIEKHNILEATKMAMLKAVSKLSLRPDMLLIDAITLPLAIPQRAVIGGDDQVNAIAAASILAKVYRDHRMLEYAVIYPEYHFESNKGYGSAAHLEALREFGASPIHRMSFLGKILSGNIHNAP